MIGAPLQFAGSFEALLDLPLNRDRRVEFEADRPPGIVDIGEFYSPATGFYAGLVGGQSFGFERS